MSQNKDQEYSEEYKKSGPQQGKIHNMWHTIKITQQAKKQENIRNNKVRMQSIETDFLKDRDDRSQSH